MRHEEMEELKYPIGKYKPLKTHSANSIKQGIKTIREFPDKVKKEIKGLNETQLEYRHRPGGWTLLQLVHHCADSHINAFCRVKLALSENKPVIKPYDQSAWANADDASVTPVEWSLSILDGLHKRWAYLLDELGDNDYNKQFIHPELRREVSISDVLFLYAWHCEHHLAHIKQAKKYKNNFPS
jgi:hypothetical protein